MALKASAGGSNRTKLENVRQLQNGVYACRLYAIIDMGSQHNPRFNKWTHKVRLQFEFPDIVQKYYAEDEYEKPVMISLELTFSMHKKSNLRKMVENMRGSFFASDAEAENFDLLSLVNHWYGAQVQLQAGAKDPSKLYENIVALFPFDQKYCNAGVNYQPFNETIEYSIAEDGFQSEKWLKLYRFLRDRIKTSKEATDYASSGGVFAEPQKTDAPQNTQQPQQQAPSQQPVGNAPSSAPAPQPMAPIQANSDGTPHGFKWVNNQFTYDQMIKAGWNNDNLVDHGYMEKVVQQAPAAPAAPSGQAMPQAPAGPPSPSPATSAPTQPQAPQGYADEEDPDLPF